MFTKWLTADSKMHKITRRWTLAAIALTIAVTTAGCSLLPDEPEEEILPAITPPKLSQKPVYTVGTETLETKVRGIGALRSLLTEDFFFVDEGKRVKEIYVRPGDRVEEGQLLAEVDVADLERNLRTKKLNFRKNELAMIETLRRADELEPEELEQAKIDFELARTEIVELEESIAKAKIYATFPGTVISVQASKGETVQAYSTILTVADLSKLTVAAKISKEDAQSVAIGMEAFVNINAAGDFTGKVSQLPIFREQTNQWDPWGRPQENKEKIEDFLLVEIEPFPEGLNLGTPLSVVIVTNRKENATVIPAAALRTHAGRNYVQVQEEDGTKREVDVEIGQQTSTSVEIIKGLTPGQKVVGR